VVEAATVTGADGGTDGVGWPLADLATLAATLVRRAGREVVEQRESAVATATTKSSPTDPVTEGDRAAETIVVEGITAARPDDAIIGEEGTERTGTSGLAWHIDPIDGTTNYLYGIPAYSVSVAVGTGDTMLCGAVFNPVTDELFEATVGAGATLNGRAIAVSPTRALPEVLVATGFGYRADRRRGQARVMAALLPEIRDIRRFGSAALDLCSVACGRVDAYYEVGLNLWDYAAGALIASEAGALCTDLAGGAPSGHFLLAAPPGVHGPLGDRLRELEADLVDG
jgi:myo-inositol-1(or 4)-monophosphatase